MSSFPDTKGIFAQLADTDGADGVRTIIENHDAWLQNGAVMVRVDAAMRAQVGWMRRGEVVERRVREQQERLAGMVTRLPMRVASAG